MGDRCHFAHGDQELRSPNDPINPVLMEAAQKQIPSQKPNLNKPRGGFQQQNFFRQPVPGGALGGMGTMGGMGGMGVGQPYSNFKTVRCKFFDQGKTCPYGTRCSFAHGEHELRQPQPQNQFQPPMGGYMMPFDMQGMGMFGQQMQMDPSMMGGYQQPPMMDFMAGMGGPQSQFMGGMPPQMVPSGLSGQQFPQQPQQMQAPAQTRFTITTQQTGPDGKVVPMEQICEVYIYDNSPEVNNLIGKASDMINKGQNDQAMEILLKLMESNKIVMTMMPMGGDQYAFQQPPQ